MGIQPAADVCGIRFKCAAVWNVPTLPAFERQSFARVCRAWKTKRPHRGDSAHSRKGRSNMARKRNRGNGEGSIFKRTDDGPYFIQWYDAAGKRKSQCTKTTDKAAAQRILAKKLADVALRRDGVIDARQESIVIQAAKPIETHLADFIAMMMARRRNERHIKSTI